MIHSVNKCIPNVCDQIALWLDFQRNFSMQVRMQGGHQGSICRPFWARNCRLVLHPVPPRRHLSLMSQYVIITNIEFYFHSQTLKNTSVCIICIKQFAQNTEYTCFISYILHKFIQKLHTWYHYFMILLQRHQF